MGDPKSNANDETEEADKQNLPASDPNPDLNDAIEQGRLPQDYDTPLSMPATPADQAAIEHPTDNDKGLEDENDDSYDAGLSTAAGISPPDPADVTHHDPGSAASEKDENTQIEETLNS